MKGDAALRVEPLARRGVVMTTLSEVTRERGTAPMTQKLSDIRALLEDDLSGIDEELRAIEYKRTPLHESAKHLVASGGKRIRPMCVALASRIGTGFDRKARELAVAAELVHSATLLHDDVVDLGDKRRGLPTSRVIYGNAASIFAGDWLLVEALLRVRRTELGDVLDGALGVLTEMLEAESLQLARRGKVDVVMDDYMKVVRGKTASLFRWALFAGARAGGLAPEACESLASYGSALGVAFQVIDDVLDVDGDSESLGKEVLQDLREGKMTYPLLVALLEDPELADRLRGRIDGDTLDAETRAYACTAIKRWGGSEQAKSLAVTLVDEAIGHLEKLPDSPERQALASVARAVISRRN
jgi:octaprenyl-diphosphate synthase